MLKDGKGAGFKGIGGETSTPPNKGSLTECLRHEANSEHGLLGLVQQFHVPFAVLLQAAGNAAKQVAAHLGMSQMPAPRQSVERRSSGAPSDRAGSDLVSDLTGSIPVRSTCGVSTRTRDASAERVCSDGCSERGRATARAISICATPWWRKSQ